MASDSGVHQAELRRMRECGGRIIHKQHGHAAHGSFAAQLLDLDVACTLRAGVHIPNIDGADAVAGAVSPPRKNLGVHLAAVTYEHEGQSWKVGQQLLDVEEFVRTQFAL